MAKSQEKITARKLRRNGESIKQIAKKLHVSASSVSTWCNDILLTKKQIALLEFRMKDPTYGNRQIYLNHVRKLKEDKIANLRKEGIEKINILNKREFIIAGLALYWAEGFKKDKQIGFANIDPRMVIFFLEWLQVCFDVKTNDIKLRLTVNESYIDKISDMEKYWSKITRIPTSNFQKPIIQKVIWKKEYENKDQYHGVLRIRVAKSLAQLRIIDGMIEGLYRNTLLRLPRHQVLDST